MMAYVGSKATLGQHHFVPRKETILSERHVQYCKCQNEQPKWGQPKQNVRGHGVSWNLFCEVKGSAKTNDARRHTNWRSPGERMNRGSFSRQVQRPAGRRATHLKVPKIVPKSKENEKKVPKRHVLAKFEKTEKPPKTAKNSEKQPSWDHFQNSHGRHVKKGPRKQPKSTENSEKREWTATFWNMFHNACKEFWDI